MATWTQDDIDQLKLAIATGILTVRYDGPPSRMITYHSLESMRSLLSEMLAGVAVDTGVRKPYRLGATRKGFDETN